MCLIQYVNTGSTYMGNHGPLAGSDDAVAFYNLHTYECFLHSLASSKVILWPSKVHLSWSFPIFYRALDGLWNVQTEPRAASIILRSMLKFRQGIFRWNCWASSMFPWMPDGDFAGRRPLVALTSKWRWCWVGGGWREVMVGSKWSARANKRLGSYLHSWHSAKNAKKARTVGQKKNPNKREPDATHLHLCSICCSSYSSFCFARKLKVVVLWERDPMIYKGVLHIRVLLILCLQCLSLSIFIFNHSNHQVVTT